MKIVRINKFARGILALSIAGLTLVSPQANAAQTYTGTEDSIIDITPMKSASIITISYTGEGVFTLSPVDATGKEGLSYMLQIGEFTGTYFQAATTKPIVALAVKGTGEWSITIDSIKNAPKATNKSGAGSGTTVVNMGKASSGIKRITWSHAGDGVFSVTPIDAKGKNRFPLFLKIGDYKGTVMLPSGIQYFEIKASGDWTYSIK